MKGLPKRPRVEICVAECDREKYSGHYYNNGARGEIVYLNGAPQVRHFNKALLPTFKPSGPTINVAFDSGSVYDVPAHMLRIIEG